MRLFGVGDVSYTSAGRIAEAEPLGILGLGTFHRYLGTLGHRAQGLLDR